MTGDGNSDDTRTWVLHNPKSKSELTITLSTDVVLTVTMKGPQGPARSDEKTLKSYEGALNYIKQFIVEREVRGFKLVRDSHQEKMRAELERKRREAAAAAAAAPALDERFAGVLTGGAVTREGWVAIAVGHDIGDDVIDAIVTERVDTVQLVCDGGDDDDDGAEPAPARCLAQVLRVARPALRRLVLDTHFQTLVRQVDEQYGNRWGDLSESLNRQPRLERVYAAGLFTLRSPLRSKSLIDLSLASSDLGSAVDGLKKSALPSLSHLGLASSLERPFDDDELRSIVSLLASDALPALGHLDVDGATDPIAILEAAAQRPLLNVRVAGALDDEERALPRLLKLASAYRGVSVTLALDTFSAGATAALAAAWPTLHDGDNHGLFLPTRYTTSATS